MFNVVNVLILLTVSTSFSSLCDRLSFVSTVSRFFTELFNGAIRLYFVTKLRICLHIYHSFSVVEFLFQLLLGS